MDNSVNFDKLKQQFGRMGARLEVSNVSAQRRRGWRGNMQWSGVQPFSANIRTDENGEHFTMRIGDNSKIPSEEIRGPRQDLSKIQVLDVQSGPHLLGEPEQPPSGFHTGFTQLAGVLHGCQLLVQAFDLTPISGRSRPMGQGYRQQMAAAHPVPQYRFQPFLQRRRVGDEPLLRACL